MVKPSKSPRLLMLIMGASFLLNLAFNIYRSVFQNFAVQAIGITEVQYGWLEGMREVPGLVCMGLVFLLSFMKDERLYAASIGMTGLGIGLYASAHTYPALIVATMVQSTGFHLYSVMQDSMVIKSVTQGERAGQLGRINSVSAAATLLGVGVVAVSSLWVSFRPYFIIAGVFGILGGIFALSIKPGDSGRKAGFVFNWRYRSYYILTLLQGARRHIVLTFASFALVKLYGASVTTMSVLLAIHSALSIWTRPMIGRIIDRMGEQRALSLNYIIVAAVFAAYAFVRQPWIIYALFILDNVMSGFDIAVSTHAGRIIPRAQLSSSIATGTTINHIFGVLVPIVGGLLWAWFGPTIPFLMGVGIVLIAMIYSWNLDARTAGLAVQADAEAAASPANSV